MNKLPDLHTTKGLLFYSLLFILLVEGVWVINYFATQPNSVRNLVSNSVVTSAPNSQQNLKATLSLSSSNKEVKVGQKVSIDVNLDSQGEEVDGLSLHLNYSPDILEPAQKPVSRYELFPTVLSNQVQKNKVVFRSMTNLTGPFYNGNTKVAQVEFTAKKVGTATLTLDFTPGSTQDTNVASHSNAGTDILKDVGNLTLKVVP